MEPIASTDYAWNESSKELLNDDGMDYKTAFIPEMDLKKTIVPISTILDDLNSWYATESKYEDKYFNKTKEELEKRLKMIVRKLSLIWLKSLR